jgi:hypothetical protein
VKTSNFGPRTVVRLTRPAFLANHASLAQIQPPRTVPNVSAIANLFFSFVRNLGVVHEKRDPRFEVPGSKFRKPRTSNLELPLVSLVRRLLGSDGGLNKLGPLSEIGRAPDLVGVIVVGAFNDIEGLGWLGRLEDLPT